MEFMTEYLATPIKGTYDLIVVGAGPAGCGAALAAARNGLSVLLIEKANCLGGAWGVGFMNPLFDSENKGGILRELIDDLTKEGAWGGFRGISIHYETMKLLLDRKMAEAGVTVLTNTNFARTVRDGKTVHGVIVENIEGRSAYFSEYVVDATGDGNVCAEAGCAYDIGGERGYRDCQAMTLMFLVSGIPEKYNVREGLMFGQILARAYEKFGKESPFQNPYIIPVPNAGFGVVQFTHMYEYNPLSATDVAKATAEGRRQMMEGMKFLKAYDDDFRDMDVVFSAPVLGIRESRRIRCDYTLTLDDLLSGKHFDDGVCEVAFNVDVHKNDKGQKLIQVKPYQIPLAAMLPVGYEGIVVAGRCISGTQEAMASYRVTADCFTMGEGAGRAIAEALRGGKPLRKPADPEEQN